MQSLAFLENVISKDNETSKGKTIFQRTFLFLKKLLRNKQSNEYLVRNLLGFDEDEDSEYARSSREFIESIRNALKEFDEEILQDATSERFASFGERCLRWWLHTMSLPLCIYKKEILWEQIEDEDKDSPMTNNFKNIVCHIRRLLKEDHVKIDCEFLKSILNLSPSVKYNLVRIENLRLQIEGIAYSKWHGHGFTLARKFESIFFQDNSERKLVAKRIMQYVRGNQDAFERLPALRLSLSIENLEIEFSDENLVSCKIAFQNHLSGHVVVRMSRFQDQVPSFYFGVESIVIPKWDPKILRLEHRNLIIDKVLSSKEMMLKRVKESFMNTAQRSSWGSVDNAFKTCRHVLGIINALLDSFGSWNEMRLWLGHDSDRAALMLSDDDDDDDELRKIRRETDRVLGYSMKTYESTSRFSQFALKTLSELFTHHKLALNKETFRKENVLLKYELEISKRRIDKLEKEISRIRLLAESEVSKIKEDSDQEIRKWKNCATTIRPTKSEEIEQLTQENLRLSALVARLNRTVHALCTRCE